jgi:hypothetical protein
MTMGAHLVGRLWTAVLVLAAVFAMHGAQCSAAAHDPAVHASAAHAIPVLHAAPAAGGAGTPVEAAMDSATMGSTVLTDTVVTAAAAAAGSDSGPGSWATHLWAVCLAVLAAGIAVLFALFTPRLVGLSSPALRRARARAPGWPIPPRPPDLSALCLLRI